MFGRFPLIGAVLGFIAFLLLGYGVDKHDSAIQALAFALIAIGVAMMGLHAIITREWRWGRYLSRTDTGFRAVWRGVTLLIAAAACVFLAWTRLYSR